MPVLEVLTAALCLTGGVALDALAAGFVLGPFLEALRVGLLLEALLDSAASPVLRHLLSILYLTQRSIVQFVGFVIIFRVSLGRVTSAALLTLLGNGWQAQRSPTVARTCAAGGSSSLSPPPSVQKQLWLAVLTAPPLSLLSPSLYSHFVLSFGYKSSSATALEI